jgi:hypothetical protein
MSAGSEQAKGPQLHDIRCVKRLPFLHERGRGHLGRGEPVDVLGKGLLGHTGSRPPDSFNGLPGPAWGVYGLAHGNHGTGACVARLLGLLIVVFPLKEFHGQPEASNTGDCLSAQWQHPGAIIAALPACTGCNPYLHKVPGHSRR